MLRRRTTRDARPTPRVERTARSGRSNRTWRERAASAGGRAVARRPCPAPAAHPAEGRRQGFLSRTDWGRVRIWTIGAFFTAIWGALWARAYYLQMVMGPEYAAMARKQHTARETVRGMRGRITDRNGNVLAMSLECDSVRADPSRIPDKNDTALKLAGALDMNADKILNALSGEKQFVWLKRKADFQTAENVRALRLPGVYIEQETERIYPYRQSAGQLLGFVDTDDRGIEGLEKSLDDELAGRAVTRTVERDAAGRRLTMPGSADLVDLRGRDIRLTLDTQVQFFAEEALAEQVEKFGARWGGCLVVDVPTGEILAWAQYPFFDPNNVNAYPPAVRRNRPATDMLEQGSTIKSFLIASALEEKVVTPSTTINCEKGMWKLGRFMLHDTHPYANLTVEKILHVSSNIGAAKIGLKLGKEKYHRYLKNLGFGERTGLPLPGESRGILRPAGRWAEIDLATASFGQSFSATLAQMAKAYLVLAGGGVKRDLKLLMDDGPETPPDKAVTGRDQPRPASDAAAGTERERASGNAASAQETARVSYNAASGQDTARTVNFAVPAGAARTADLLFSPSTMKEIRNMLREVVEEEGGTGKQARIPGLVVGGKTGTSQKADATGKYGKGRVGSFVGMLPIENPRYLICVLLDEPTKAQYGGVVAAPVFRHVAMNTMAYHGILPSDEAPPLQAVSSGNVARRAAGGKAGAAAKNARGTKKRDTSEQAQSRTQPSVQPQAPPQPPAQPSAQPQAQSRTQPQAPAQPLAQPQAQSRTQPQAPAQPLAQPQARSRTQPLLQPRTQPSAQPQAQPPVPGKERQRS